MMGKRKRIQDIEAQKKEEEKRKTIEAILSAKPEGQTIGSLLSQLGKLYHIQLLEPHAEQMQHFAQYLDGESFVNHESNYKNRKGYFLHRAGEDIVYHIGDKL